jgi:hypothetical protein
LSYRLGEPVDVALLHAVVNRDLGWFHKITVLESLQV